MSWPMQGSWNPGMSMTPVPDMMSMAAAPAGYAPEQWAALQQQNWQQWAQWQQQFAQWQTQYGEKYAQQMQVMQQAMGNVAPTPPLPTAVGNVAPAPPLPTAMGHVAPAPPLPTSSAVMPPAPPPPDNPPPPLPPHENNQPLYKNSTQPTPVPAPAGNQVNQHNYNAGYDSNFATGNNQNRPGTAEQRPPANQLSVNAEALKKLAEEERLFDIQFQKWEEEIEKWKRENVNHPDKKAYKEYEDKFEACRRQLMERREQMKQKRARLLNNAPQPAVAQTGNNNHKIPTAIPPSLQNENMNRKQSVKAQQYQSEPYKYPQQDQRSSQNQQYTDMSPVGYKTSQPNDNTVDRQARHESYQTIEEYSSPDVNKSSFLSASGSEKGIPGLDLVPEIDKASDNRQIDVIEIPDADDQPPTNHEPDYTNISKGINNILGDEKIMNILTMVRDQVAPKEGATNQNVPPPNICYPPIANVNMQQQGNQHSNQQHGNQHNVPPPNLSYPPNANVNMQQHENQHGNQQHGSQHGNQWNRNDNGFGNQHYNNNRPNEPYSREAPNYPPPLLNQMAPKNTYSDDRQGNTPSDPCYKNRNDQYGNQMPGGRYPNMAQMPPRPQQDMPVQNMNQYPTRPYEHEEMHNNNNNQSDNVTRGIPDQRGMPNHRGMQDQRNMVQPGMPDHRGMQDQRNTVQPGMHNNAAMLNQPPKPKWVEEPLFTPSVIVEYEHKPLRLKAREFIEPVHMFDYNHKSKDDEYKRKDFEKEVDDLFIRKPRRVEDERDDRYLRDPVTRDYERRAPRAPREEIIDDYRVKPLMMRDDEYRAKPPMMRDDEYRAKPPLRDDDYDRRRLDVKYEDRRRDDRRDDRRDERDRSSRRDDYRERDRDRDFNRDRYRDHRDEERRPRSRSRDRDRKRHHSIESERSTNSKKSREIENTTTETPRHVIMIDDILESPGREMRPDKIVIIMRGPPGSGKSYLAKLIRDKEAEYGGTVRIMSIDDYFMQEGEIEERDPATGKLVKKPLLKYEYDDKLEETYLNSLKRAFKRSLTDGYFTFLIYDAVNDQLKSYADIWNFARQNGFQVYVCTTELDSQTCYKRNIHNRTLDDIEVICSRFFPTPAHHIELDPTNLLQNAAIQEVHMEDVIEDLTADDDEETEVESVFTSKWEKMDGAGQLARLDGTSKPLRASQPSMEDYLQLDEWTPNKAKPGKKTVRWADIEERREQDKLRAIGFVVGKTDWNRMTDPTMGSSALTKTKYIERVRRN